MNEYLFLFRSEEKNNKTLSPDEMQQYISKWAIWTRILNETGRLKYGDKLSCKEAKVITDFGNDIQEGPYIESNEVIGGYMIILANNIHEAVEIGEDCPIYIINGSLEIRASFHQ